ncbi:hypothetical protein MTR_4g106930 [Medicago truncatula]|uniref:Uncharacterized protein n=1 Tax=Medicago truncatula TaxID=3880 RepID=G7JPT6_MEDTR|nr:hypothetical protein MTR_4g106930 [Medicago truncatula]
MIPGLLEVKLPSLCNLKSMEIKLEPLQVLQEIFSIVKEGMLVKAVAKSRKEADELRISISIYMNNMCTTIVGGQLLPNSVMDSSESSTKNNPQMKNRRERRGK